MDNQDYATPLRVSRACYDEVRAKLVATGRPWLALEITATGAHEALDMRSVLLVPDDAPPKIWHCMVCNAALPVGDSRGMCDPCRKAREIPGFTK